MKTCIYINHKNNQCGVYQYGKRTYDILKGSTQINYLYFEIDSVSEYNNIIKNNNFDYIIYNYHSTTMGWLTNMTIQKQKINICTYHEATRLADFDIYFNTDCTFMDNDNWYGVPRPLFNYKNEYPAFNVPTIGSFGFGFQNKGFVRLVKLINKQYSKAIINLHIPFASFGDSDGNMSRYIAQECRNEITNKDIQLNISHTFLSNDEILKFLSRNQLNAFLYDEVYNRGLSSVIDYALSVNVPIAISKTNMFRHINNTNLSICVEERSLSDIISSGCEPLLQYKNMWSQENFINKYDSILNSIYKL